jgi:5-methylcytosine-specific restriction endonuclease McrA
MTYYFCCLSLNYFTIIINNSMGNIRKPKFLTGQRFGKLLILGEGAKDNLNRFCWVALCDCGNTINAREQGLLAGSLNSCGCLRKEKAITRTNQKLKDAFDLVKGRKFNLLTVRKLLPSKDGQSQYRCKCDCGKTIDLKAHWVVKGRTKSCGCLRKVNAPKGQDHYKWVEHKKPLIRDINDPEYKQWRLSVMIRDKFTCQITNTKGKLVVHHLDGWDNHPDLRFDVNNAITLRPKIHNLFHSLYGRGNNTRVQWEEFITRWNANEFLP